MTKENYHGRQPERFAKPQDPLQDAGAKRPAGRSEGVLEADVEQTGADIGRLATGNNGCQPWCL